MAPRASKKAVMSACGRLPCPGLACGLCVNGAAEEGPPVTVVVLDVVPCVEEAAQSGQVVGRDCLVGWGERLLVRRRAVPADVCAEHLVGDPVCPVPGDEFLVDARDGPAAGRVGLLFRQEHVIDDGGERVECDPRGG